MYFLQNNPFFRLLLPLVAGIVFAEFFTLNFAFTLIVSIFSLLLIVVSLTIGKPETGYKFRWIFGAGLFLLLFAAGFFLSNQKEKNAEFSHLNIKGIYAIELTEAPIEKKNSFLCRIKLISHTDSALKIHPAKGKAILYIAKDSASANLISGQRLLIQTTFIKPDGAVNPDGFNYAGYLKRQGIGASVYISSGSWMVYGQNTEFSIIRHAENAQQSLMDVYRRFGIDSDEFAVLAALTLGSKDALHPELRQNYTTSGGMHILAVSGLHVGIIYMVLVFMFGFMKRNKQLKISRAFIIVTLLWAYAFITGLPPSVIRATLMFSLIAIGSSLERKAQIYNTISAAAFVMLFVNPDFLFDVGFQLSFSAVVTIVYFQPKIARWLTFKQKPFKWAWELTAVSLAAQIGTAPFSLYYFHQFPNYFLLTNFVAIPFASFIIYTAVALFVLSPVPYVSSAVAFVLHWMLRGLNYSIETIHDFPFSLTVTSINFWQLTAIFCFIILFTAYLSNKKFIPLMFSLVFLLVFSSINLLKHYAKRDLNAVLVFSDNSSTHVSFLQSGKNYVFSTDSIAFKRVAENFILNNKLDKAQKVEAEYWFKDGFAEFNGKRFLILTDERFNRKFTEAPLKVDYLIIGNKLKPRINDILACITPSEIIIDRTISGWYTQQIKNICKEKNIRFYAIAQNGAYIQNLRPELYASNR